MRHSSKQITRGRHWLAGWFIAVTTVAIGCDNPTVSPDPEATTVRRAQFAQGSEFGAWETPVRVDLTAGTHPNFNTGQVDGCPFVSRDGKSFYMASNRAGSRKDSLDIWVSTRESETDGWGEPENVTTLNADADDFCPTISRDGHLLYFASRRAGCGGSDIWVARRRADGGFDAPEMLPCDNEEPYDAVNSPRDEWGPFPLPERGDGPVLYFSSFREGGFAAETGARDSDIYRSESHGGVFGKAELVPGVNTAADDGQPNVARDGLDLYFYSTRVIPDTSQGAADLYVASRANVAAPWSDPVNLGKIVNSAGPDSRPSLSWDGSTLYFGSGRAGGKGMTDIWVTVRKRVAGNGQ